MGRNTCWRNVFVRLLLPDTREEPHRGSEEATEVDKRITQQKRHLVVSIGLKEILDNRVAFVHLDISIRIDQERKLFLTAQPLSFVSEPNVIELSQTESK